MSSDEFDGESGTAPGRFRPGAERSAVQRERRSDDVLVSPTGQWCCRVTDEVRATDWAEWTVVDVVTFAPATTRGFEDGHQRTEVYRYRERAPPPTTYDNGERSYRVERLTRPLAARVLDTG